MIHPKPSRLARAIFNPYIERLLKKSFTSFYAVSEFPVLPENKSVLLTPNHFSWWDGFFIDAITRRLLPNKQFNLLMLEDQLEQYFFFKYLGCFSINLQKTSSMIESIKYSREVLSQSSQLLVVYPQGEIEPYDKPELTLKNGIASMVKGNEKGTVVLPVGFKIQYDNQQHPDLYVRFGSPMEPEILVRNFTEYTNLFTENIRLLNEASVKKEFAWKIW